MAAVRLKASADPRVTELPMSLIRWPRTHWLFTARLLLHELAWRALMRAFSTCVAFQSIAPQDKNAAPNYISSRIASINPITHEVNTDCDAVCLPRVEHQLAEPLRARCDVVGQAAARSRPVPLIWSACRDHDSVPSVGIFQTPFSDSVPNINSLGPRLAQGASPLEKALSQ